MLRKTRLKLGVILEITSNYRYLNRLVGDVINSVTGLCYANSGLANIVSGGFIVEFVLSSYRYGKSVITTD